ncbi:RNA polymerase factor sigma-54 [Bacillus sp. es.034]|uniref:RNA polymerase factor sigma-54 n=1 Tax=Bacillus sp. es.034 TaxID=1761763 RepID=UPI000BF27B53|nr:RNA polymerase factor sigma-54 [Bacillus sp. es.034]PFG04745.1 RNA polymerase RpoN-/SigL-like sigma 54 subunit [Bacillus sp. es.034]
MNLKAGLFQNQQLKLQMTQQLSQAITILQYSTMELNAYLEAKQLENPLIQVEPPKQDSLYQREPYTYKRNAGNPDHTVDWYEYVSVPTRTLADALSVQINLKSLTFFDRKILDELICSMDDNGYLRMDEPSFLQKHGLEWAQLENYIKRIQDLEPAGIGARSLQECISLQLERKADVPPLVKMIVNNHFQAFGEKKWKAISKELGVELKEIQQAADFIQHCNPRPGSKYSQHIAEYITPELVVNVIDGHTVAVSLHDGTTVNVTYNEEYTDFMKDHPDQEVQTYLQEKEQDFRWLLQSLRQRKQTILKVGKMLAEKQKSFFLEGPSALQPLTLKQVADEIDVHESTISRAVKGKYMQTPFGIFELKYFFTSAIKSVKLEDSEAASARTVKNELQKLIDEEDKKKPLSDQKIVNLLLDKGYDVSRRTIAKYRDQMGITSSTMRKRYE